VTTDRKIYKEFLPMSYMKIRQINLKNMNKKRAILIVSLIKIPFLIYLMTFFSTVPSINAINQNYIQGAHRGASLDYEENTLLAFDKALQESKYEFIEFDIQYTKDKKIVVFHENDKFRQPKKGIEISEMTYDELQETFDFHIPQYHEVMDLIDNQKPLEIEIKSQGNHEEDYELIDYVINDCKQRKNCHKLMITSPSEHIIKYTEENYPEIKTGRVYWVVVSTIFKSEYLTEKFYQDSEADYLLLHGYNIKNYELLKKLKPENKQLIFWYFTDEVYLVGDPEDCIFWDCS